MHKACRELIKADVLVPVTRGDPQIIVQFDGSAHSAGQVGGVGAALLQYDGNGLVLLDWNARVLPKCADNIVAEANGADLAMHLYEKYVRMCYEQNLISLPLNRKHGDIKQLLHHLDFRSRLRRNDLIPLINTSIVAEAGLLLMLSLSIGLEKQTSSPTILQAKRVHGSGTTNMTTVFW